MLLPGKRATVRDPRAGVALLIVLGLLALLMITAVAFTILMRIERASASNLRHTSAARQMAKGGLAYAIAALNADIGTNRYPDWPDRLYTPANHSPEYPANRPKLHLPEDLFISVDEAQVYADDVTEARVLSAETARYLPGSRRYRAEIIRDNHENAYASPEWIPVATDGKIIGRYAYVILNTSGLLDANRVHTNTVAASARWLGAEPGELQLDPAIQRDVVRQNMLQPLKFALDRVKHGRYETLPELATLNTGLDGAALANFDVFSYAVPDLIPTNSLFKGNTFYAISARAAHQFLMDKTNRQRVDLSYLHKYDSLSASAKKALEMKIKLAFLASGLMGTKKNYSELEQYWRTDFLPDFPPGVNPNPPEREQINWAFRGLLDYADADNVPAGGTDEEKFARPATEAMPLFSVFALAVNYVATDFKKSDVDWTRHTVTYDIRVVYSYPFQTPRGPFKLDADVGVQNRDTNAKWEALLPPLAAPENVSMNVTAVPGGDIQYLQIVKTQTLEKPKAEGKPDFLGFTAYCRARTSEGTTVLRQTPSDYDNANPVTLEVGMNAGDIANGAVFWSEAIDPRCNWDTFHALWRANRDYNWERTPPVAGNPGEEPLVKLQELIGYPMPSGPMEYPLHWYLLTTPSAIRDYFKIYTDGMRVGDDDKKHCDPVDSQLRAHVANRPLQSAGELGYLPIGLWLTINLYDHGHTIRNLDNISYRNNALPSIGFHPVLDFFVIGDPNKGRSGLVNLGTRNPEVMGALFNKLPIQTELYTHTPASPGPVIAATKGGTCDDAVELAQWLIDKGPFERFSDLRRCLEGAPQLGVSSGNYTDPFPLAALKAAAGAGGVGEFEREALIRNICNLVTLRGQTFTIILRADAFSPRFGMKGVKQGNVLATAMAVAQVWRDTEPMVTQSRNAQNKLVYTYNYPTFVQFFKILNE